MLQALQQV
jgi:hypothetical protein